MSETNNHPAFDAAESAILSNLVPEGADANEPLIGQPAAAEIASAPAVAAPAPAPAVAVAATPAQAPAAAPAAAPAEAASAPAAPAPPQGGDTRAALRASRHAEKRLREELDRTRAEVEALKSGNRPVNTEVTDEEIAQAHEDFPLAAKLAIQQRELQRQLAAQQQQAAPAATEFEPLSYPPEVQEVIDSVPQLLAWQYDPAAQAKFNRAIEYDKALLIDPDWRGKSDAERITEAARRAEAALSPSPTPSAAPAAQAAPAAARLDPAAVIADAPIVGPKGISDFRGGAPGHQPTINYAGMSDEAIMASLPAS